MDKLKNMTLKKTFFLIVFIISVIVIFLSAAAVKNCSKIHDQITLSHAFTTSSAVIEMENGRYIMDAKSGTASDEPSSYTKTELMICKIMELLIVILPITFSILGIVFAGTLFYHIKLKEPLTALRQGICCIANNNLDFSIECQKQDELGELCRAFESMRQELVKNNRYMWDLIEERKKINASISHDLRTPITVIKGYSEYLGINAGQGTLTEEGTHEIAVYIHQAASRLEEYADSVHEIQALEDMHLEYQEIPFCEFEEELRSQISVIARQNKKEIHVISDLPPQTVLLSSTAVFRITENIIANALRYCKERIEVSISYSRPFLSIIITDDGKGFSPKALMEAVNCFYKEKSAKEHFGIGLFICKTLAAKHGGCIKLENMPKNGAKVTVKIKTEEIETF